MAGTDNSEWDLQAAEFVLGTLSAEERLVYAKLQETDVDWQRRVAHWQRRLNPLNSLTAPVEAPGYVLNAVLERIDLTSSADRRTDDSTLTIRGPAVDLIRPHSSSGSGPAEGEEEGEEESSGVTSTSRNITSRNIRPRNIRQRDEERSPFAATLEVWRERARYWQLATVLAVASFIGLLFVRPIGTIPVPPDMGVRTVALLLSDVGEPLWAITYIPAADADEPGGTPAAEIAVTVVGNPAITEQQSHQLWMVLPEGAGVQSVGLLPDDPGETRSLTLPIPLEAAAEFAVSLEDPGGVPGPEHGPLVARTFIIPSRQGI